MELMETGHDVQTYSMYLGALARLFGVMLKFLLSLYIYIYFICARFEVMFLKTGNRQQQKQHAKDTGDPDTAKQPTRAWNPANKQRDLDVHC